MKYIKLFMLLVMSAATLNLSAAIDAKATIRIKGAYTGSTVNIYQDNASSQLVDFIETNMSPYSVNVYAEIEGAKYSSVKQADLHNLVIKFCANQYETSYTVEFSNVLGDIKLVKGSEEIDVDATAPYTLTCTASEVVTFVVKMHDDAYTRTVSNVWGTICLPQSVDADKITNATIYSVASQTETELYLEKVTTGMAAGTPYIFCADAAGEVKFAYNNDAVATPVAATGLVGTFEDRNINADGMYVISNNAVCLADAASTVKANRAYINLAGVPEGVPAPAPGRKYVSVRIANAATGIENAEEGAQVEKQIVNGKLLIRKAGVLYNVQGQIVK